MNYRLLDLKIVLQRCLIRTWDLFVAELKQQVEDLKQKAEAQMTLFKNAQAELLNLSTSTVSQVEERHKKELEAHVNEANKKYNALVMQTAKKEEELKAKFENEISELRKNLANGQKSAAEALAAQQKDLEGKLKKLENEKDSILQAVDALNTQMLQQQNEAERQLQLVAQQKEKIAQQHAENMAQLRAKLAQRRKEHEEEIIGFYNTISEQYDPSFTKQEVFTSDNIMRSLERDILLRVVDNQWIDHLHNIDMLRDGIGLRAYGQKDPLIEYKKEAYDLFNKMMYEIQSNTVRYLFRAKFGIQFVSDDGVEIIES